LVGGNVLDSQFVGESSHNIFSFNLFHLLVGVLLDELVDMHETTTDSDHDFVSFLNFNVNTLLTELVHSVRLSQEHDFHLFSLWVLVQVISQSFIDLVVLLRDVNCLIFFKSLIKI